MAKIAARKVGTLQPRPVLAERRAHAIKAGALFCYRRAAAAMALVPETEHGIEIGKLLAELKKQGIDVEILECALAEV